MKWSWKLAKVAGIEIQIHATFLILLIWIGLIYFQIHGNLYAVLQGILFLLAVFGTVVLHELSHALTARVFGIHTKNILLLPIGGIAQMEKIPEKPMEGLLVSLAGPAVNLLLAAALFALLKLTHGAWRFQSDLFLKGPFLARFMWVNVGLAVFNLLPAFPMDGGRVLRSLLAFWVSPLRATQIAARMGQTMAIAFFFFGLFSNPFLILIAVFIWMGAAAEASMAEVKAGIAGLTVQQVMITNFQVVSPGDSLAVAADHILAGFQHDFPVVEKGRLVGVLTQSALLKALAQEGKQIPVRRAMQADFATTQPSEPLGEAFTRFQTRHCRTMPVVREGHVVGILTLENISEWLMIRGALEKTRQTF